MKPITFSCSAKLKLTPRELADGILDVSRWPTYKGYGPLPGIKAAEFESRTPEIVGSRVRVTNTDGSNHVEEIIEWQADRRVGIEMKNFSPPASRLATKFVEIWEFEPREDGTQVSRYFELHPKTAFSRPVLWLIAVLLKKSIERHMRQMRA